MTTPEEAKTLFPDITVDFPVITGSPTDNIVKKICKVLTYLLQSIDVPGGAGSLSGLLGDDADCHSKWQHSFDCLDVALPAYNLVIQTDAINTIHSKAEMLLSAKLDQQCLFKAVERLGCFFFQAAVKETWFLPLK